MHHDNSLFVSYDLFFFLDLCRMQHTGRGGRNAAHCTGRGGRNAATLIGVGVMQHTGRGGRN